MNGNEFSPETYPLGHVKVHQSAEAVFLREPGGKKVVRVLPGCGCTTYTQTDTELRVTFTAGDMPEGVKEAKQTSYQPMKNITVSYDDESYQQLWVTAIVHE